MPGRETITTARAVVLATGIAAVATLPTLGRQPLSWDEAVTLTAARRSMANLAGLLAHTDLPLGTYYLLMHIWLDLPSRRGIGVSEAWLRLPSAVAACGAVAVLVILVSRWFTPSAGALAGSLLALHPLLTFYAQDARPYSLVAFTFLLSTWALGRALDRPTAVRLTVYALLATLTLYLHLLAVYALSAHVLLILLRTRDRRRHWALVGLGVMAAVAPLVILSREQTGELGWIPRPSPRQILGVVGHLAGGVVFIALALTLIAVAILRSRLPMSYWTLFLVAWAVIPPIALVVGNLVTAQLVARYGLVAVPAMVTLVAVASLRTGGRLGAALAAAVLVAAAATTAVQQLRPYKYEDYRAATDLIADNGRPGDAVLFLPMSVREGYDAYLGSQPDLRRIRDLALAPAGQPQHTDEIGGVDRPAAQVGPLLRSAPTVFLLGRPLAGSGIEVRTWLHSFRVARTYRWGDLELTVFRAA